MADTTTQVYNQTVNWGDYSSNTQVLFTTDANTRYVIKDMEVDNNTYSSAPTVSINGTKVASLSGNLTGTEIVDVSSTVNLNFDTGIAAYIGVNNIQNSGQNYSANVSEGAVFVSPTGFAAGVPATGNTANSMTQLTNYSNCLGAWLLNGNFYYIWNDSNSQQALYRRAGGISGSQSTIYSGSYSPCIFDGVSKFYSAEGGAWYVYDTATSSRSYLGSAIWGGSTYPLIALGGGFVFYSPSYTGYNSLAWLRLSDNATGTVGYSNFGNYTSQNGTLTSYDSATGIVRINAGNMGGGTTFYTIAFNVTSGTPVLVDDPSGAKTASQTTVFNNVPALINGVWLGFQYGTKNLLLMDSSLKVTASKSITNDLFQNGPQQGSLQVLSPSTAVKNAVSPSMKLRITGVKSV